MKHIVNLSNGQQLTILEQDERIDIRWGEYWDGWIASITKDKTRTPAKGQGYYKRLVKGLRIDDEVRQFNERPIERMDLESN